MQIKALYKTNQSNSTVVTIAFRFDLSVTAIFYSLYAINHIWFCLICSLKALESKDMSLKAIGYIYIRYNFLNWRENPKTSKYDILFRRWRIVSIIRELFSFLIMLMIPYTYKDPDWRKNYLGTHFERSACKESDLEYPLLLVPDSFL